MMAGSQTARLVFAGVMALFLLQQVQAQNYPVDLVGAWMSTRWTDDRTKCSVVVDLENLTKDRMHPVPVDVHRTAFLSFPSVLKATTMTEIGKPELPYVQVTLEVPEGANASIAVDKIERKAEWNEIDIVPATAPWPEIHGAKCPGYFPDQKVYGANRFFPYGEAVEAGPKSAFRGRSLQTFYFYPVKYNPALRVVHLSKIEATIHLSFEGSTAKEKWVETNKKGRIAYSSAFGPQYLSQIASFTPPVKEELPVREERDDGCDYLVIVPNSMKEGLEPLLALKRNRGLKIRSIDFNSLSINEMDSAESRRNKIRARIEKEYRLAPKPSYLLLVGDATMIPPYLKTPHPYEGYPADTRIATDLFYSTLEGDKGSASLACGRLPARNANELKVMVSKILEYEKAIDSNAQKEKWGLALVAAEYENEKSAGGECNTVTRRWFQQTAYNVGRFLLDHPTSSLEGVKQLYVARDPDLPNPWCNFDHSFIPVEVLQHFCPQGEAVKRINEFWGQKTRLVLHRDHGSHKGWGTPAFTTDEVAKLSKPELPPIVLSLNCETGWYDDPKKGSFALDLMRSPNGASAVIAASRVSWSRYNDRLTEGLVKGIWDLFEFDFLLPEVVEGKRIGPVLNQARQHLLKKYDDDTSRQTVQLFNLFGDPEMRITVPAKMVIPTEKMMPTAKPLPQFRRVFFPSSFVPGYR